MYQNTIQNVTSWHLQSSKHQDTFFCMYRASCKIVFISTNNAQYKKHIYFFILTVFIL